MTLKRVLGPVDAAWIVSGNMIGAGIFAMPGLVVGYLAGTFWPLVAWLLGGLLALCGAAVYAELGARIPRAGGDYQYLTEAFGPVWGFLTGWAAMLLTFSAAAAAMSIVAVGYLRTAVPLIGSIPDWVLAPVFVLLLTVANLTGARVSGRTTAWFTAIPLLGLLVLFGVGLVVGDTVARGDAIARSGNSGFTDNNPHLHFELYSQFPYHWLEHSIPVTFRNTGGPLDERGGLQYGETYTALD